MLGEIRFGGERFIYYHEWDPCLLPLTDQGRSMLQALSDSVSS